MYSTVDVLARSRSDGGQNPGNNLHVSGLSLKVDMRELETAFAKIGRVRITPRYHCWS